MSRYTIAYEGGNKTLQIEDNTKNEDTSLVLYGRGKTDYGQDLWTNMIRLMENFASNTAPSKPVLGQTWYNTTAGKLKVYAGPTKKWVDIGSGSGSSELSESLKTSVADNGINGTTSIYDNYFTTKGYSDKNYLKLGTTTNATAQIAGKVISYSNTLITLDSLKDNELVTKAMLTTKTTESGGGITKDTTASYTTKAIKFGVPTSEGTNKIVSWRNLDDYYVYTVNAAGNTKTQNVYGNKKFANATTFRGSVLFNGNADLTLGEASDSTISGLSATKPTSIVLSTAIIPMEPSIKNNKVEYTSIGNNFPNSILVSNGLQAVKTSTDKPYYKPPQWDNILTVLQNDAKERIKTKSSYVLVCDLDLDSNSQAIAGVNWKNFDYSLFDKKVIEKLPGAHQLIASNGELQWVPLVKNITDVTPTVNASSFYSSTYVGSLTGTVGNNQLANDGFEVKIYSLNGGTALKTFSKADINFGTTTWTINNVSLSMLGSTLSTQYKVEATRTVAGTPYKGENKLYYKELKDPVVDKLETNDPTPTVSGTISLPLESNHTFVVEVSQGTTVKLTKSYPDEAFTVIGTKWEMNCTTLAPGAYKVKATHGISGISKFAINDLTIIQQEAEDPGVYYIKLT